MEKVLQAQTLINMVYHLYNYVYVIRIEFIFTKGNNKDRIKFYSNGTMLVGYNYNYAVTNNET